MEERGACAGSRKTIGVLFGGYSSEYPVSLQSAYSVITSLNPKYYDVISIGITKEGRWLRYGGDPKHIKEDTWDEGASCVPVAFSLDRGIQALMEFHGAKVCYTKLDVVFPVLHGKNGEDGTVQGLLTLCGIPFVGCGTESSALCMDKDAAHKLVQLAGVKAPRAVALRAGESRQAMAQKAAEIPVPLFVKPVNAGSSFGVARIEDRKQLGAAIEQALFHDDRVIIEEAISGFEVGCAVLGNEDLIIGEVDEIELSGGFFDYTEKYTLKSSKIHMPARITEETAKRIKKAAAVIYRALHCRGIARVDLFLTGEGDIVFNEVNTIPGFTAHSRYPGMLAGIGISFPELLDRMIELAVK